jgi:hypothetical protein
MTARLVSRPRSQSPSGRRERLRTRLVAADVPESIKGTNTRAAWDKPSGGRRGCADRPTSAHRAAASCGANVDQPPTLHPRRDGG